MTPEPADVLLCHRCGSLLEPGRGGFYVVRIEAFADPTGPVFTAEQMGRDATGEIEKLMDELRDASEREMADQVHRRVTLHLCNACYAGWIEDPAS